MNIFRCKILTKRFPFLTARNTILCTRRLQPPRDDCALREQWVSIVSMTWVGCVGRFSLTGKGLMYCIRNEPVNIVLFLIFSSSCNICILVYVYHFVRFLKNRLPDLEQNWASLRQNLSSGFSPKRVSNQSPQLQRLSRKLKFHLYHIYI